VQASLYDNEDVDMHYRLGKALQSMRDEGVLVVGAGMAVHNLRDFRASRDSNQRMPYVNRRCMKSADGSSYATEFDEALQAAVTTDPTQRQQKLQVLSRTELFRKAHPSLDHILPLYIAAGAGCDDEGVCVWSLVEKSLSWAQFRFGQLSSTKGRKAEL
jgi:4,5-DOPA dioxygenase extradiol